MTALARTEGRRGGFCVLVDAPQDDSFALTRDAELACYRAITEAFANIVKHARARNVALTVTTQLHDVDVRVVDDGEGFDVAPVEQRAALEGRLGLLGMHERLQQVSGSLTVTSTRGAGTTVTCRLPRVVESDDVQKAAA